MARGRPDWRRRSRRTASLRWRSGSRSLRNSRRRLCSDRADPWSSALLLPAMRLGEPLEIEAAVSSELAAAVNHLQTVYRTWLPATTTVPVRSGARLGPPPGPRVIASVCPSRAESTPGTRCYGLRPASPEAIRARPISSAYTGSTSTSVLTSKESRRRCSTTRGPRRGRVRPGPVVLASDEHPPARPATWCVVAMGSVGCAGRHRLCATAGGSAPS